MDARGYGRRGVMPRTRRLAISGSMLLGLMLIAVGAFGLLDDSAPALLRMPPFALGAVALAAALVLSSRGSARTRYRADPWSAPEWIVAASGAGALLAFVVAGRIGVDLEPPVSPLHWPTLPLLPAAGVLVALLPAWCAPVPPALATVDRNLSFEVAA